MTLDIRGSLKNTKINKNTYIFIDELFSNAIDSYLIRKHVNPSLAALNIDLSIEFTRIELFDNGQFDLTITCTDNGAGFEDHQVKAFVTKDTSYKDDLAIEGIGECRGSGRIQFLHYFKTIKVDSRYESGHGMLRRTLCINDSSNKEINEDSFAQEKIEDKQVETTIVLAGLKPTIYEKLFAGNDLRDDFSAESLKNYVMVTFLQRFVSLKDRLGAFCITITTNEAGASRSSLTPDDLPEVTTTKNIVVYYKDEQGRDTNKSEVFTLSHYKLVKTQFRLRRNLVALCAKSSAVKNVTSKYLKPKSIENNDIGGYYHIVLIESKYLSEHVNSQRDDFNLPEDAHQEELFLHNLISFEEIYHSIDDAIYEMLTPPDWSRECIVKSTGQKYGISSRMISESNIRIRYGDTEEKIVKRVLSSYQEHIIQDTSDIFDIQLEISKTDPTSKEFRDKVNALAWKYTSSLKYIDMTSLSQLVVRRAAMLDILNLAINKGLAGQVKESDDPKKRCDERIIHNILFPMGKDSSQVTDHDVWLLNEEYQYFDYIASDKALSTIRFDENDMLFDSDIDINMKKVVESNMRANVIENSAKRPDIAIFSKEGSAIIIELKAPGVNLEDHVNDLMEYAQLLAAKSNGKLKKFYGYLLGTSVNPNRLRGYKRFPSGKGWFGTDSVIEPSTNVPLGELYSEILFYQDIVERANKRLDVYKKKLGINAHFGPRA